MTIQYANLISDALNVLLRLFLVVSLSRASKSHHHILDIREISCSVVRIFCIILELHDLVDEREKLGIVMAKTLEPSLGLIGSLLRVSAVVRGLV